MDCWNRYEWALENCRTLFVSGPPGVGKTFLSYYHKIEGKELFAMTLGEEASSVELRGHYISKGAEAGTVWHNGPLTSAVECGKARFVVNEISNASPDILGMLYAVLEDPSTAKLTLPTGKTLEIPEDFQCVFTDNFDADRALPVALKDRIEAFIHCTEPHPNALANVAEPLRKYAKNAVTTGTSGLRAWNHLSKYLVKRLPTDVAVELAFGQVNEVLTSLIGEAVEEWKLAPTPENSAGPALSTQTVTNDTSKAVLSRGKDGILRVVKPAGAPSTDVSF
jgi:hypothetical protein